MRESERKGKEVGELKASRQKEILLMKKMSLLQCLSGDFIAKTPFTYYQNNKTNTITMGEIRGDNQKVTKRSKK